MTDQHRILAGEFGDGNGHRDFPYWCTGQRTDRNELFDIYEARPKASKTGNYDYLLVVPRQGMDEVRNQVSIGRIAGRSAAASQMCHPAIIPLIDAELDRPPFFWVEPRLRSPNLHQVLTEFQLSVSSTIWIIRQISQAIMVAHNHLRTLSALEPTQIHVSSTGRVVVGGLDVSVPFGQTYDSVIAGWDDAVVRPQMEALVAGPEVDLSNFGRLIQWMIERTRAEAVGNQFVSRLSRLAIQAMDARSSHYSESLDLSERILDSIINLELDNVTNDQPFGQAA